METNTVNKPSQVMAWLGFGISLALFLLVWTVNAMMFSNIGDPDSPNSASPYATLYLLLIVVGSILGVLGLVFSIVGLVTANKNGQKKLPGVLGITLCCASLLSVFSPIFYAASFVRAKPTEEMISPATITIPDDDVVLTIDQFGDVKCSKADGSSLANMRFISKYSFSRELETWLQTNGYNEDVSVVIKSDKEADYESIVIVIDALKELGIKKYRVESDNP